MWSVDASVSGWPEKLFNHRSQLYWTIMSHVMWQWALPFPGYLLPSLSLSPGANLFQTVHVKYRQPTSYARVIFWDYTVVKSTLNVNIYHFLIQHFLQGAQGATLSSFPPFVLTPTLSGRWGGEGESERERISHDLILDLPGLNPASGHYTILQSQYELQRHSPIGDSLRSIY